MNHVKTTLAPGLWFVGVPIGTARDITLRALDVLASADVLAAEDTRSLRKLMDIHGVPLEGRRIEALHEHSKDTQVARLVARAADESVAYASEAGMPLIADPGFELGRAARAAGVPVTCAPGPSAVLTALVLGGLPTDAFHFGGFLPATRSARLRALEGLAGIDGTLVLYESPKRLGALLADAVERLGADRQTAVCRELTKRFEEVKTGSLQEMAEFYSRETPKGEIVVLIGRAEAQAVREIDIDDALVSALRDMTVKDAASFVAESLGLPRRRVYQRALDISRDMKRDDGSD
ncbi:16S rRNA (cytidine(1402)-2'-O)-methyltransferase [Tateyamaria sp. ANG-S1]|uniref:16S rRNA (cytidine(1402)-2'-O)-methyltransferase n=1 Tax=Tateyamaria sp. ANG-S1 TaxID=1577905 RepID=UPI0005807482|nr:16S rRNA (cytidine(1402)-2'-O)-methyltransferase [Tateyamaria sp. ANG-S1]KIC50073.1 16S rRNA methyltransferase [Tateyamaria sp. ANG-S1]